MREKIEHEWREMRAYARATYQQFCNNRKTQKLVGLLCLGVVIFGFALYMVFPPTNFPTSKMILLPEGASAPALTEALVRERVIAHPTIFLLLARITGFDTSLTGGAYIFSKPVSLLNVLVRIGNGEHGITQARVTFTEGMTVRDMANILSKELPGFNSGVFFQEASTSEGFLFPDTYFILPGTTEKDLVKRFTEQFIKNYSEIILEGEAKKLTSREIVILASILEREAKGSTDMKLVAGILYNRLAKGMPLQVDAVFGYIHGKNGYTPTGTDLRSESPYNTYRNKGLPPTPIDNPGLEAISAAAQPTKNSYYFYLTGRDGVMRYAKTFEEHKRNRTLYLD